MNIIIVGLGQTGRMLAEVAAKEHYDVTVVDNNKEVVEAFTEEYNAVSYTHLTLPTISHV